MHWIVLPIMLQASDVVPLEAPIRDSAPTEVSTPSQEMEDCKEGVKSLRDDFKGLELYLQDKKDHKDHCPGIKWTQPELDKYKEEPKSYLPETCKAP